MSQRGNALGDNELQDHAGVAELADAPDSKSGGLRPLGVRVPPPAYRPNLLNESRLLGCVEGSEKLVTPGS